MDNESDYKAYGYRWFILAMFCGLELANNMLWVTFAPISDITSNYFGGSGYYASSTSVNMLANIFLITYLPGTALSIFMMKYFNLRKALAISGFLTMFGALLRYIAAANSNEWGIEATYAVMILGQVCAGIGQPMLLNSPPAVASIWFPTSEREIATTIGSMFSPIGSAVGQIIPFLLVSQTNNNAATDDDYTVHGMANLMLVEFILCVIPLTLTVIFFKDQPPTAPSKSTKLKIDNAREGAEASAGVSDYQRAVDSFKQDMLTLLHNKDYILLVISFGIGVGFFNALLTLLNQIVQPFGYSNDDAGTFGAVFIVFGLVGAGSIGSLMEKTKAYRPILKIGVAICVFFLGLFLCMLFSNNYWPLLASIGILGFFMLPLLPVMMENCAECTYPIPEDMSMGVMFATSNLLGLGFIFALQYLLEVPAVGPPPFLPSNFFIIGVLFVAFAVLQFFNGPYKRLAHEALKTPLLDPESQYNSDTLNPTHSLGEDSKASSLVRVTSMDSGGSGNGSNHLTNTDLSVANSSLNMWNNSTVRNSSFSDSTSPNAGRVSSAVVGGPTPAARQPGTVHGTGGYTGNSAGAGNKNADTLQVLVTAAGAGRAPSSHNLAAVAGAEVSVSGGESSADRGSVGGNGKKGKAKKGNK